MPLERWNRARLRRPRRQVAEELGGDPSNNHDSQPPQVWPEALELKCAVQVWPEALSLRGANVHLVLVLETVV